MKKRAPRRLRVLVADDDRDLVLTLMALLRDKGHEARGVHYGADVVDTVAYFSPDVLLLDVGLPRTTGYEIARSLRDRYGSARPLIVAIVDRDRPADRQLTQLAGFDHHLVKPFEPKELLRTLETLSS